MMEQFFIITEGIEVKIPWALISICRWGAATLYFLDIKVFVANGHYSIWR